VIGNYGACTSVLRLPVWSEEGSVVNCSAHVSEPEVGPSTENSPRDELCQPP
jgi:hypothetical protein